MRIEQYFLMTDYSLWEVILNGDSPVPTIVVDGVVQPVDHRSAEQKLARRNELKAHGNPTQNLAFVSSSNTDSTTDSVSAATSVYVVCAKLPVSSHHNINSLNNAVIYSFFASKSTSPQLDNEDLKQIDVDDLEKMDLRWQMAMLTIRARGFLQKKGINLSDNKVTSMRFNMSKVKCYNCYRKRHLLGSVGLLRTQKGCYDWSYQAEEDPANFALMAITSSSSSSDNKLSPSKHTQDLSHTNRPSTPIIEEWVSDSEDESETNDLQSALSFVQSCEQVKTPRHFVQPVEAPILDAKLKPTSPKSNSSSKKRNRKTCFVCRSMDYLIKNYDYHAKKKAQPTPKNYAHEVLTQSKPVSITAVRPVCAAVPKIMVTRPRHAHPIDTKSKSHIRRHITCSPSPKTSNSPPRLTAAQALVGNSQYALKDKGVIDSRCSRHMSRNMSYLSDFEELNGGYVAFGGNPKGGKISGKGKIKTGNLVRGLPTKVFENNNTCVACKKGKEHRASCKNKPVSFIDQPLFRLHMDLFGLTFVKILNKKSHCLVITDDYSRFTWVFFLATKDETSPILKTFITGLENQLSLKNKDGDAAFDGREHEVHTKMPESAVNVSPSSSAQSGKQDDKTNKKAKGKSFVESFTGNRDLSTEFKYHSDNSSNDVNAAGFIVPTVGQNSSNSTNPFSTAGPSNTTASPTHGKYSFKDASQLLDNLDMLEM
nr:putative ribonuclease H-like domain-containing protein [Tanacetum cinerariifolium]